MNDLTKRIFRKIGRFAIWIAPQLFEAALDKENQKRSSLRITQTRQTLTNTKTTKQTKGDK